MPSQLPPGFVATPPANFRPPQGQVQTTQFNPGETAQDLFTIYEGYENVFGAGGGANAAGQTVGNATSAASAGAGGAAAAQGTGAASTGQGAITALGGAGPAAGLAAVAAAGAAGFYNYGGKEVLSGDAENSDYVDAALQTNPVTAWVNPVLDVFGVGSVGGIFGGKHKDVAKRDKVRGQLQSLGLTDDRNNLTLADGSTFSIGFDQKDAMRDWKDSSKRVGKSGDKLAAYDTDYTSDLDFFSGMGGISLTRLISGTKAMEIDQVGSQIGNAAIGNIGFGAEMTQDNFNKMTANQRAIYAKAGVKSKDEAYALANKAFAEGRINDTDLVGMHQSFNMIFDNDYATAQKLSSGRWKGLEEAAAAPPSNSAAMKPVAETAPAMTAGPVYLKSKEQAAAMNKQKYGI